MTDETSASTIAGEPAPSPLSRFTPRAGVRAQLLSAAIVWLVGASILAVRGVIFLSEAHWAVSLVALALVLGIVKGHMLLYRTAEKAVARIRKRGTACYFGFFSWKAWLFVGVMMGGGVALRHSVLATAQIPWGRSALAVLYIAVAVALIYADRVYWLAAFGRPEPAVE